MPGLIHSQTSHRNLSKYNYLYLILTALILVLTGSVSAVPVPRDIADKTAQDWSYLHGWHLKQAGWKPSQAGDEPNIQFKGTLSDNKGNVVAYKYALPTGGEVVIANEDGVSPVFTYSPTTPFNPSANPTAQYLFDIFVSNVNCARQANKTPHTGWVAVSEQAGRFRSLGAQSIANAQSSNEPLIITTWGQGEPDLYRNPYNKFCPAYVVPYVGTYYSITGCTATAMAQIMNFWKAPETGQGNSGEYTCDWSTSAPDPNDPNDPNKIQVRTYTVTVPNINFSVYSYDWANMPEPSIQYGNYVSANAVALLMYHCGASVHMDYTPYLSGAYTVKVADSIVYCAEKALRDNFQYRTAKGIIRENYTPDAWETIMKNQVLLNQPVLYTGYGPNGSGGHAFVLDGYQEDLQGILFHFNLGWDGMCDGWYTSDVLIPTYCGSGFPTNQNAIIDIYTPYGPKGLTTLTYPVGSASIIRSSYSNRFVKDAKVTLTVKPYPGYRFDHWEGELGGNANPVTITMDSEKTVTAVMVTGYTINLQKQGEGSVTVSPVKEYYEPGDTVTVQANPAEGWSFDHWEGDLSGTTNPATLTMNRPSRVKAVFKQQYRLVIVRSGEGEVTRQPSQTGYSLNTFVTLTATPAQGWVFRQWSGDIDTQENPTLIKIDGDKTIKAEFTKITDACYTLSVTNVGQGQVTPMNGTFAHDTKVILTAVPSTGWKFYQWQGDVDTVTGVNPLEITMNKNRGVSAVFVEESTTTTTAKNDTYVTGSTETTQNPKSNSAETQKDSEFHFPNLINSCTLLSTVLLLAMMGGFFLLQKK